MVQSSASGVVDEAACTALLRELAALDDLVGSDPDTAVSSAHDIAARAAGLGAPTVVVLARVAEAEAVLRRGDPAAAADLVRRVLRATAPDGPAPDAAARSHWVLSRVFSELGDRSTALEHALDAAAAADDRVPAALRVRIALLVADLLDDLDDPADAAGWYARAEELATGDGVMHLRVVDNRVYRALDRGDVDVLRRDLMLLFRLSAHYGVSLDASFLDTVARVQLACGDVAAAEAAARRAVRSTASMTAKGSDNVPSCLLTLAAVLRTRGDVVGAAEVLGRARSACATASRAVRVQFLAEQAELHAAVGDHGAAFTTFEEFHAADRELLREQREAQARARQTMFETDLARAEAARFREQARCDALTGLRNRLHVDERLPALVEEHRHGGPAVGVVLFDLDHFTSVNDTFSHDVGDEVLRQTARLLQACVDACAGEAFAAHLGGEEFLAVVAGGPVGAAADLAETVRRSVAGFDWSALVPGRGVTVSAGVAVLGETPDGTGPGDRTSLLLVADERLYAAKAGGRNRVRSA